MSFDSYPWGARPAEFKGIPIGDRERGRIEELAREAGTAAEELALLRERPEIALRVAAFLKRSLGREIDLRESAGFLDPYVRLGSTEYSLLRGEGHGLRELVVLLTATYGSDSQLLVVDEPELHLHPAMARLWVSELRRECIATGRQAIVVTHEPSLVRPQSAADLSAVWVFSPGGEPPKRISDSVLPAQRSRVDASLKANPSLVSDLVFSPRPVLVEGPHDVAALSTAIARTQSSQAEAQTDLVPCGGSTEVALWFEISRALELDVRAVADLDALFTADVQRVMDGIANVAADYRGELGLEPPRTKGALEPIVREAGDSRVPNDPRSRAEWLVGDLMARENDGHKNRVRSILSTWKSVGMWLHPQGTLESVLGISTKGVAEATAAASAATALDDVAAWVAYELDVTGDLELLLNAAVERIAHTLLERLRAAPEVAFMAPTGPTADADARLVEVINVGPGIHRIVVRTPEQFAGYWVDFSRETPPSAIVLTPPA